MCSSDINKRYTDSQNSSSLYEICILVTCVNIKAFYQINRKQLNFLKSFLKYLEFYIVVNWRWFNYYISFNSTLCLDFIVLIVSYFALCNQVFLFVPEESSSLGSINTDIMVSLLCSYCSFARSMYLLLLRYGQVFSVSTTGWRLKLTHCVRLLMTLSQPYLRPYYFFNSWPHVGLTISTHFILLCLIISWIHLLRESNK